MANKLFCKCVFPPRPPVMYYKWFHAADSVFISIGYDNAPNRQLKFMLIRSFLRIRIIIASFILTHIGIHLLDTQSRFGLWLMEKDLFLGLWFEPDYHVKYRYGLVKLSQEDSISLN